MLYYNPNELIKIIKINKDNNGKLVIMENKNISKLIKY